jgi:hypothetical protein
MARLPAPRRLFATVALVAVVLAMSAGAFLHEARAEADGACVACLLAQSTVGIQVVVAALPARLEVLGFVEPRDWAPREDAGRLSFDSRGPPLA